MTDVVEHNYKFPNRGDEYWRFTKPDQFIEITERSTQNKLPGLIKSVAIKAQKPTPARTGFLNDVSNIGILFQPDEIIYCNNGKKVGKTLEIGHLNKADGGASWATEITGVISKKMQKPIPRPFAKYCVDNSQNGFCIWAKEKNSEPVFLTYGDGFAENDFLLHNVIKVSSGASLTLVEIGNPWTGVNQVNEVHIEPKGEFNHIRLAYENPEAKSIVHQYAKVDESASLKSFSLYGNTPMARNEHIIELLEDNASAYVSGIFVGNGQVSQDDTVFIHHEGLNGTSRQVFRKVLNGGATGVFQGKIHVNPGAQKTDGYQKSQALLLDEQSQFLVKPELEIYADDVSCSHGSTCGSIDTDALYYLRSRGICKQEATSMLSLGFLKEVLEEIENKAIAEGLEEVLTELVNDGI